jgi:hypothetical protein
MRMRTWKKYIAVVFAGLFLGLTTPCAAADAVLEKASGQVLMKSRTTGNYFQIKQGAPLSFGDQLKTGQGGLAHVVFKGGTAVLVKGNSRVALRGNKKDVLMDFETGEFLIGLRKKLTSNKSFRVKTPVAVAAVRGTLFWGLSDAEKTTTYACFSGSIAIEANGQNVTLAPGQTVKIPDGKPMDPVQPANIPSSYLETFAVDNSIQGLDGLLKEKN